MDERRESKAGRKEELSFPGWAAQHQAPGRRHECERSRRKNEAVRIPIVREACSVLATAPGGGNILGMGGRFTQEQCREAAGGRLGPGTQHSLGPTRPHLAEGGPGETL